ncbi:hypothetical protein ACOIXV_003178 [Vibrio parahaemolyticus]
MEHSNRLIPTAILFIAMLFTPFAVEAETPSHHERHMDREQFKTEIEASKQRIALILEQSFQRIEQQKEVYRLATIERLERYHARQIEMSKDLKELLRREGL